MKLKNYDDRPLAARIPLIISVSFWCFIMIVVGLLAA